MTIDGNKRRAYRSTINDYGALLNKRLNDGKITEDKFWFFQNKLTEWYNNYMPIKTHGGN